MMKNRRIQKHVKIYGRVQGVYFRNFTLKHAERLGVCGWVKNMADGTVEANIQGGVQAVGQLLEILEKGPVAANVEKIEELSGEPSEWLDAFSIIR